MALAAEAAGIKFVGVSQPKPLHGFSKIFKICLPQENLELIRFWGVIR